VTRVLVTGATGFIGQWASAALIARGYQTHGTVRSVIGKGDNRLFHVINLLDEHSTRALIRDVRPTHMLLTAWSTKHGHFWTDPANDDWVASTESLVRSFFSAAGRRVVFVGSCAEYDWTDPILECGPVRENAAQGEPQTVYGRAKRRAAQLVGSIADAARGQAVSARIFFPIGPGENSQRFLPTVVNQLLAGRPAELGPGDQVRDLIDVRDVGAALAALVDSELTGAINIASGRGIRLAQLARQAAAALGRLDLLRLGALPPRPGDPPVLIGDISRLERELRVQRQYSLSAAISESIAYWQRRLSPARPQQSSNCQ
jgi:nucleoside-diphosphate-sugar epimerase